jgi:cobalt-precorrin-5B (C1)-methyltransferase
MVKRLDKRYLRTGYTTGACAAAAACASASVLLDQKALEQVSIDLPGTGTTVFKIHKCSFDSTQASCSVIKDAGDDPDITHGAEICTTVSWTNQPGITITSGEGVGIVTKPGLEIPVGLAAINPVPRRMIEEAIREIIGSKLNEKGVLVSVSVPNGRKLAGKTLNSRLGIEGGISILGTTGIVIPYSISAYKTCIAQSLDIALACNCCHVVLTTGRRSEKYAQSELSLQEECFIQAGDFIGFSLQECNKRQFTGVIIWGMTGKISKLAAGHLYTNTSDSRIDIGFLAEVALDCGIPEQVIEPLRSAITANQFRRMLPSKHVRDFCDRLCSLAAKKCNEAVSDKINVECIMSSYDGIILGRGDAKA